MALPPVSRFDGDTAVTPVGGGRFEAELSEAWSGFGGPNGGYLGALVVRAMEAVVDEPARSLRSVTFHFLRSLPVGPIVIEVSLERQGRSVTALSARLGDGATPAVLALAAFGGSRPGPDLIASVPPVPERPVQPIPGSREEEAPIRRQLHIQRAVGEPVGSGAAPITGGWIRLVEPRDLDASLAVLYLDAWIPPVMVARPEVGGAPTLDLTVHLRRPLPVPGTDAATHYLARHTTVLAADGYLEEDGELWSPDGLLVAQSRQVAVATMR